jgi:hypothetical protein
MDQLQMTRALTLILGMLACTSQQNVNVNTGTENGTTLRNSNEQTLTPTAAVGVGPGATASANQTSGLSGAAANMSGSGTIGFASEPTSVTASNLAFAENFGATDEGQIPSGWITDDGLGVMTQGRSKCLGMLKVGEHKLRTPEIGWPANFRIEVEAQVYKPGWTNQYVEFGAAGVLAVFGSGYDSKDAKLTNASDLAGVFERYVGQRVTLALEKRGTVFRTFVDDNPIMLSRKSDMTGWGNTPLSIKFFASNSICIYRVAVRRLPD